MTRCVIYCRVSTDAQERDGTSLETQLAACREHAAIQGWNVASELRDSASGFSLDRPGMDQIRRVLKDRGTDIVLAFAVDRLSRNQNHIGVLFDEANQAGVRLDFVTEKFEDTAVGRFILAARAFVAEVEREKIIERTQRGKAQRARSGKLPQATGRGIYGYRYDPATGTRQIDEDQAAIVRQIFEAFIEGGSCHGIALDMNEREIPAFSGGKWYPLTIRRMLLNETYTGRSVYRRFKAEKYRDSKSGRWRVRLSERDEAEWIEVEGATPPIVSGSIFSQVQTRLADPERRRRGRPSRAYPLSGRLRCESCGAPMVGQVLMKGRYSYYRCRGRYVGRSSSSCSSKYIRTDSIEGAVRDALLRVLADPDRILAEAERFNIDEHWGNELETVIASLGEIEAKQRRLVRLFTDGDIPEKLLDEERSGLSRKRMALEEERRRIEDSSRPPIDIRRFHRELPKIASQIREWILRADETDFDLMLRALNVQMVASPDRVNVTGTVPMIEPHIEGDLATIERTSA